MFKKSFKYLLAGSLFFEMIHADVGERGGDDSTSTVKSNNNVVDGFLNIKFAHERSNDEFFGPKNASACALNPVITIGDLTLESDFYYGRQFSNASVLSGKRNFARFIPDSKIAVFYNDFKADIGERLKDSMKNNVNKAHFYRTYSRGIYENKKNNFRIVFGDTVNRNQIGFQQALSGLGVSFFRQNGNGSVISNSSPIVITRVSKVECKLGEEILCVRVFAPGVYSIDDFPEEAKLPGVTLKISDQLSRSDTLKVDYFGGYSLLPEGKDDFDVTFLYDHKWDIDNPHALKYNASPRFSSNYRYGITDDMTIGAGLQYHDKSYLLDYTMIFKTGIGIVSPNIAYSYKNPENESSRNAFGAGIYYAAPENSLGISFEVFMAAKSKGFTDLGKGSDKDNLYDAFMQKNINEAIRNKYKDPAEDASSRQIVARVYAKPICGVVPAFIFNGEWSKSQRLREYTLSFIMKPFDICTITVSAGLTYDDPYKGINQQSPDRRLTVTCSIPIGKDFEVKNTYSHHDEQRLTNYTQLKYTPSCIPGLEITAERTSKPKYSNPVVAVKYDNAYCNIKVDENIKNTYGIKASHVNQQRLFFGTSLSPSGVKAYRKSNYNVLRTAVK